MSLLLLIPFLSAFSGSNLQSEGKADLFQQGEKALESQDWEGFNKLYERLKEKGADPGKTAYNQGRSLFNQGEFKDAGDSFGEAASLLNNKKASQALYNRGNALMKQGESDQQNQSVLTKQAVEAYEKALELNPRFKEAARNLEIIKSQEPPPEDSQGDDSQEEGDSQDNQESEAGNEEPQGDQNDQDSSENNKDTPTQQDQNDSRAQDILDQEENDRSERETTLPQAGGGMVERDW